MNRNIRNRNKHSRPHHHAKHKRYGLGKLWQHVEHSRTGKNGHD